MDTNYQCVVTWDGIAQYTLDTYYDVFTMSMEDAWLLEGEQHKTITCKLTGARRETMEQLQWYQQSTELGRSSFINTFTDTVSTSVATADITTDKEFKCQVSIFFPIQLNLL